ncbi:transposase, partial [Shigella dysenteriae]
GSHASTLKSPSYTKSVSWSHYRKRWSFRHKRIWFGK